MSTKEGELIRAVFVYVSRCIAERDSEALCRMRLDQADIRLLSDLRVTDMERFATQPHRHFLEISFHRESMRYTLSDIRSLRRERQTQQALMLAGAPRAMMAELYGINHHHYAALHCELNMPAPGGRLPKASEEDSRLFWRAWREIGDDGSARSVEPERYLKLHQETGLSLRVIWPLVEEWFDTGQPGTRFGGQAARSACG